MLIAQKAPSFLLAYFYARRVSCSAARYVLTATEFNNVIHSNRSLVQGLVLHQIVGQKLQGIVGPLRVELPEGFSQNRDNGAVHVLLRGQLSDVTTLVKDRL
eukprot:evm.model.scf_973.9 EVM.evm.TU.scf_973.9   scf_973:46898-47203(+)